MEQIRVDIIPGRAIPVCHASQFDDGRVIRVNLTDNYSSDYILDGTEEITVNVRKVDGNIVVSQCDVVSGRSYVDIVTTEQMTACHGSNISNLTIEKNGTTIGTINFILEVEKDPLEGGITSASEINNLATQVDGFVAISVADQYDSANVIFDSVPTAGHGNGYAVTSAGVKNAIPANSDFSLSGLSDTTITSPSSGQVLLYNGSKWTNSSKDMQNKTSTVTFNETYANCRVWLKDGWVSITYQGENKTHSASDVLFVLPENLRPSATEFVPFTVNTGALGVLFIYANGNATVNQVSDSTVSGRIYFTVTYPVI